MFTQAAPAALIGVEAGGAGTTPMQVDELQQPLQPPPFHPPAADSELVQGLADVLLTVILTPSSNSAMRGSAVGGLALTAQLTGTTAAALVAQRLAATGGGLRDDLKDVASRRL